MSTLDEVGERAGWRCWICDEPVEPDMSVNDPRGPSIDTYSLAAPAKKGKKAPPEERLAHRACNTGKGNTKPVIPWPDDLFVAEPAPILPFLDRLERKGGREVVGRCPSEDDADRVAAWLVDRLSRLAPALRVEASVDQGGGQYLVALTVPRR